MAIFESDESWKNDFCTAEEMRFLEDDLCLDFENGPFFEVEIDQNTESPEWLVTCRDQLPLTNNEEMTIDYLLFKVFVGVGE